MLTCLTIKNFGLIDNLTIEFCSQLNVLTGSTGAGKSIVIDGLRFALGEKLNSSQIRVRDESCIVEAVFEISQFLREHERLNEFLPAEESQLIIQRQYLPDGKTKIRINGMAVTLSQLKLIGDLLTDFHGPHDHQMLLSTHTHIDILDRLANFGDLRKNYSQEFGFYQNLKHELQALAQMAQSRQRDLELLDHQIKELSQIQLSKEAYEEVCQEFSRVNNAEKLYENGSLFLEIFENEQTGVVEQLRQSFIPLRLINQTDLSSSLFNEKLSSLQEKCSDLVSDLKNYLDSLSFQPAEAQEINRKYDIYENVLRKYGPTIENAQLFYEEARRKYELLVDWEHNDAELRARIKSSEQILNGLAAKISIVRHKTAEQLKKTIEKELKDLGMPHVRFAVRFKKAAFGAFGYDEIEFLLSPNAGEDLKPMADIVSSGEAARVMLALKRALIAVDPVPVLIFDEIDAQIGGRLGSITGKKLKELAAKRQVILITHLPQIASFAEIHIKVSKQISNGRTYVVAEKLDQASRIEELSHMMSGDLKSHSSLSYAEELLSDARRS